MPTDRSLGRDVFIYDAKDPDKVLGGLILTNGVTNANFYSMVEILIECDFSLIDDSGTKINRDDNPLQAGNYFIDADGRLLCILFMITWLKLRLIDKQVEPFSLNDEPVVIRAPSHQSGTRVQAFTEAVRQRDRRCVVSGERAVNAWRGLWTGFEAAHIFPLAHEGH
jgi:hypothetical protein